MELLLLPPLPCIAEAVLNAWHPESVRASEFLKVCDEIEQSGIDFTDSQSASDKTRLDKLLDQHKVAVDAEVRFGVFDAMVIADVPLWQGCALFAQRPTLVLPKGTEQHRFMLTLYLPARQHLFNGETIVGTRYRYPVNQALLLEHIVRLSTLQLVHGAALAARGVRTLVSATPKFWTHGQLSELRAPVADPSQ